MDNLFIGFPKENLLNKFIYICFIGIIVTYPFSLNLNSFLILNTSALSLLKLAKSKRVFFNYLFILFFIFFLTRAGSLLNTEDIDSGGRIMLRSMSLIAFPVIMIANHKILPIKEIFIKILFITTTIACLYCLLRNTFYLQNNDIPIHLWLDWKYNNYHLSRFLNFGANYFSFLIVFNLVGLFFYRKRLNISYGLGIVVQFFFLFLLSSRGLLIFAVFFLIVTVPYIAFKRFKLIGFTLSLFILTGVFFMVFYSVPVLRQRYVKTYKELFIGDMKINKVGGVVTRVEKLEASINIIKENMLLGVGIGDVRDELTIQYIKQDFDEGVNKWYDAHNQYLESFMASGIFGFFSFVSILVYCFVYAFIRRDYYLLSVLALFSFMGFIESFMETHKGIVFFSLVLTYYFYPEKKKVLSL